MIVSVFCVAAVGMASRTSRPFRPSLIGVTICSPNRSASLSAGWVSSRGGRTIEAVEKVCSGDGIEEFEVLDLLEQLVDKSLITVERDASGNSRYTMIESVWQYSREKLEASGEAPAVRDRHLNYFLAFAEEAEPHLEGPDQKAWLDRCQRDLFNIRFAWEWAIKSKKAEKGLRIFSALYRVIEVRSNLAEAWEIAMRLLALPDKDVAPKYKAYARLNCWPARVGG